MPTERRVEPWPVALAALLLGMIGVCLAFFAIATLHRDAELVDDAYAAGLAWNDEQRARQESAALGVRLDLAVHPDAAGVRLVVRLADPEGRSVPAQAVVVRRLRPAEGGLDADFALAREGAAWTGQVPLPRPGRWRLEARARLEGRELVRQVVLEAGR